MSQKSRNILVGYDGSPAAEVALRWAAETARLGGDTVRGVIVDREDGPRLPSIGWVPDEELPARVDAVLGGAGVSGAAERHTGHVVPVLLQEAYGADMLVVGSEGHGWAADSARRSVSQSLARHAPCPVVVARAPAAPAARIVVGVDGSDESRAALDFACRRASLTKECVVASHAWRPGRANVDLRGQLPRRIAERSLAAETALAECVAEVHADHPGVELEMQTIALPPALALTEASATASLVVTGSRGHGVLTGLLLGSVSHHLLHWARCPVAVVR
jgi:nucleotide-binding universal stress UspA family protein